MEKCQPCDRVKFCSNYKGIREKPYLGVGLFLMHSVIFVLRCAGESTKTCEVALMNVLLIVIIMHRNVCFCTLFYLVHFTVF